MDSIVKAQRRKFLQTNRYAEDFRGLDVAPKGASNYQYATKGDPLTGRGGNGFWIDMYYADFTDSAVFASRMVDGNTNSNSLQYKYSLQRYYQSDNVSCWGSNPAGQELCADFCGTGILIIFVITARVGNALRPLTTNLSAFRARYSAV